MGQFPTGISLQVNSRTELNLGQLLDDRLQLLPLDQLEAALRRHSRRLHVRLIQLLFHNLQKGNMRTARGTGALLGVVLECWRERFSNSLKREIIPPASEW